MKLSDQRVRRQILELLYRASETITAAQGSVRNRNEEKAWHKIQDARIELWKCLDLLKSNEFIDYVS